MNSAKVCLLFLFSICCAFAYDKVFTIVLDRQPYEDVVTHSLMKPLIKKGLLLTNYSAVDRPSQPNYIALISGSTFNVDNDVYDINATTIVSLLQNASLSWKAYMEDYPESCYTDLTNKLYTRRHNPFISFLEISGNTSMCDHIVNATRLVTDIQADTLPDYSFYVPQLWNNGHDTSLDFAVYWLRIFLDDKLKDDKFFASTLVFITFDQGGATEADNQVFTLVLGKNITGGNVNDNGYDHYSLLRTTEYILGLGNLGRNDATAAIIDLEGTSNAVALLISALLAFLCMLL